MKGNPSTQIVRAQKIAILLLERAVAKHYGYYGLSDICTQKRNYLFTRKRPDVMDGEVLSDF